MVARSTKIAGNRSSLKVIGRGFVGLSFLVGVVLSPGQAIAGPVEAVPVQSFLPFEDSHSSWLSLAVDDAGDVVVGDAGMWRAFELKAGGSVPQEIEFGTYINAGALDVDGNGNIYTFSDYRNVEVLMANTGDRWVVALPFGGALGAISSGGLAVNRHEDVFVTKYGTARCSNSSPGRPHRSSTGWEIL